MPDWTGNKIVLTGDPANRQEFKKAVAGPNGAMDFNRLKAMPESLIIPCRSSAYLGLACWSRKHLTTMRGERWFAKEHPGVHTPGQLRRRLNERTPETVALGRQARDNIRRYGVPTWYEWRSREWGTKWNACKVEVVDTPAMLSYRFDTAWDAPRGIPEPLLNLAHRLGLSVAWDADHEGGGYESIVNESAEQAA